jgi:hypothetical protein
MFPRTCICYTFPLRCANNLRALLLRCAPISTAHCFCIALGYSTCISLYALHRAKVSICLTTYNNLYAPSNTLSLPRTTTCAHPCLHCSDTTHTPTVCAPTKLHCALPYCAHHVHLYYVYALRAMLNLACAPLHIILPRGGSIFHKRNILYTIL